MTVRQSSFLLALAMLASLDAQAHITLETRTAEAGSVYKAVLKVGHGCDGSPIREIIVRLPAGVVGAKPMPKAGWALDITRAPLTQPYLSHGKRIDDAPSVIRWSGGSLPDAYYDEFVMQVRLPEQPGRLYWAVTQVCDQGRIDWADVPPAGQREFKSPTPAAVLDVIAKPTPEQHAH